MMAFPAIHSRPPSITVGKRVEGPKSSIIALGGDDWLNTQSASNLFGQLISPSYVTREDRDYVVAKRIYTDNGRVFVFVLDIWGNGAYTDTHSANEDKGIELVPLFTNIRTLNGLGTKFTLEYIGDFLAGLTNLYDGYLLHFNNSIGWFSLRRILVGGSCFNPSSAQASSHS